LFGNRNIVDARFSAAHQAVLVELPLLVAVGTVPLPGIVMPLVLKPHRDTIAVDRPQILDEAILMFLPPIGSEKRDDRGAAFETRRPVAPAAARGIGQLHELGIPRVPGVLG